MGRSRQERVRLALFLGVGLVAAAIALVADGAGTLSSQEQASVDVRFAVRGPQTVPKNIVVVAIDGKSLYDLGLSWPFPRRWHARAIDRLRKAGAKVITYDVEFGAPTGPHGTTSQDDIDLFNAAGRAGNLVFSTTHVQGNGHTLILGGDANLRSIHAVAGDGQYATDAGGVIRRVPYEIQGLKTVGIATAERALGHPIPRSELGASAGWIDFVGPQGSFRTIPFERVVEGKFSPRLIRDAIVVIGVTDPLEQDVHPTAAGHGLMPGPEIQANAIWTAMRGFPLKSLPRGLNELLIVLLAFVAPLASLRLSPFRAFVVAVGVGALYTMAVQLAFDHGRVVAFVVPLTALALSAVGSLAVGTILEIFERERIRDVFGRFVPEEVVNEVLAQTEDGIHLGGKLRVCTMMFTDLRGFTTFSESRDATEVIHILNYYFGEMSEAVMNHGGTLCSYLGDGMMIVFGAPLDQADHADRAVACAREIILDRLPRVNAWLHEQGLGEGFRMGIGLNSGPLMVGNIGSERRMEYTTIGDTVNTASRLEGLTKGTPFPLFIGETTRELLSKDPDDLVYVAELDVRGRSEKVKVWSLRGLVGQAATVPAAAAAAAAAAPEPEPAPAPAAAAPAS
jgi:adenylate cyclase